MAKGKIHWKWLAIMAGVTAVTVVVTLVLCFWQGNGVGKVAPGFTYDDFVTFYPDENMTYLASPDGTVYAMDNTGSEADTSLYLSVTSMDGRTMVYPRADGSIMVISPEGIRTLEQKVYLSDSLWPLYISFYGEVAYFFAQDTENTEYAALWRYDVKKDSAIQLNSFSTQITECVVSPGGNSFAFVDESHNLQVYTYENGQVQIQTWPVAYETTLYFVTDEGAAFFADPAGGLQSLRNKTEIYRFSNTENSNLTYVWFNKDATEMIVNTAANGCYLAVLEQGVVQETVSLKDTGNLEMFTNQTELNPLMKNTMMRVKGLYYAVVAVDSFRDLNLRDSETAERVKLTADNRLIYQANSANMKGELASSGQFILYTDANGDYFYTDTTDEEGTYNALWAASEYDIFYIMKATGQKSFYYVDLDSNLKYHGAGKDKVLCKAEQWATVNEWAIEDATDTIYYIEGDVLYCSRGGASPRKIASLDKLFSSERGHATIEFDTSAGVYCYAVNEETGELRIYRLFSDGDYRLIK